jgi:hypothetical protein
VTVTDGGTALSESDARRQLTASESESLTAPPSLSLRLRLTTPGFRVLYVITTDEWFRFATLRLELARVVNMTKWRIQKWHANPSVMRIS